MRYSKLLAILCAFLPAAAHAQPLRRESRAAIVDSVARVLEARYVDPATAARLGARVRERLAAGAYDTIPEAERFGAALMRDLQGVVRDKHLRISYEPTREYGLGPASAPNGAAPAGAVRWARIDGRDSAQIARTNFAFDRVERLAGNVGYVKLSQFVPVDLSRETVAAAMAFVAHTDAVILDLRDNVGGSPATVAMILSYFVDRPTRFLETFDRARNVRTIDSTWSDVPGRRITNADLWILTNGNTASAAEMLAYAAQRLGRGTVVGETTAGAGNGGAKLSVGAGLALFVPAMRVVSGPGYESTGVAPDVRVSADDAPTVAHRLALEKLAARSATDVVTRERAWALELARAAEHPVRPAGAEIGRYVGQYGARAVRIGATGLEAVGSTGWVTRLTALGGGRFGTPDARYRFETDANGSVTALVLETTDGRETRLPRVVDSAGRE